MTRRMTSSRMPLPPVGRHGGLVLISAPSPFLAENPWRSGGLRSGRISPPARALRGPGSGEVAHQPEDQHDDQDEAEAARRAVAPAAAVAPGGHRADEEDDQDDQQDKAHRLSPIVNRRR